MLRGDMLLVLLALAATPALAEQPLTPEMLVDLAIVRDVAVAPSGDRAAYTLEVPRAAEDDPGRSFVELWSTRREGEPRRLAGHRERISAPAWSPDGQALAFLSDRGSEGEHRRTSLWVLPAGGGEARQTCASAGSVTAYEWSPDGRQIAVVIRDAQTEAEREAEQAGRDWKVHDEQLRFHRLHVCDPATHELERWFDRDLDVAGLVWSGDGSAVIFQAAETTRTDDEYMFSKIYRVESASQPRRLAPTTGKLGPMALSPDGKQLAYLAAVGLDDPLAQSLFVVPVAGGVPQLLTQDYQGSATDLAWSERTGLLLLATEGTRHLGYRVSPNGGEWTPRSWPVSEIRGLDLSADGSTVAFVAATREHPPELFVQRGEQRPVRATFHNPTLEGIRLARQETTEWKGADGWPIRGVLTYPLDYRAGHRYPLVLQVHGGPEGVSLDGWTSSALYPVQLLAARGYFVLEPNYRGSQGRGVAFSQADHDDLGGKEFEDVLAGIDALADAGLIDPERVGTGGWSYGGYLSAWAATRHSNRFRAAVVAAGLTNWISFAGTTDIPHEMALVHWNSWWHDEPELHWQRSPLAHVKSARTPTLIVHGSADDRVHPEQSLQLYTALRIQGTPTSYVEYPREPHGLNERAHRLDFIERVLAWFDEHLVAAGNEARPTTAAP